MPSRKRKQHQLNLGPNELNRVDDDWGFDVVFNETENFSTTFTYHSAFDSRLDLNYAVTMKGRTEPWDGLKNYNRFQVTTDLEELRIPVDSYVYIRGVASPEPRKQSKGKRARNDRIDSEEVDFENWVAQVLECKAADRQHVYLRVVWLYWPQDLKGFGDRQSYHGLYEIIPSNDMQIIDAITVSGRVEVRHWNDAEQPKYLSESDGAGKTLFWRQTLDVRSENKRAAPVPEPTPALHCVCNEPANPDDLFIQCGACKRWMHGDCIVDSANKRANQKESGEVDSTVAANEHLNADERRSLLTRVMDSVGLKRDNARPQDLDSGQGELGANASSITDDSAPNRTSQTESLNFQEENTRAVPQKKGKKKTTNPRTPFFQAQLGDPASEEPNAAPTTVIITKHETDGTQRVWEENILCLFEDCGRAVSEE